MIDAVEYTRAIVMETAASQLARAIEEFRRDHALGFLQRISGQPITTPRARRFLASERAIECLESALAQGQLTAAEHAATVAHLARAQLEHALAPARAHASTWPDTSADAEGETRTVRALAGEWIAAQGASERVRLAREIAGSLPPFLAPWLDARATADERVTAFLRRVGAPRHPDAGPEGGAGAIAEKFLVDTEGLARTAFSHVAARCGIDDSDGTELLWALAASRRVNAPSRFNSEGRSRRLGNDWEALGLRAKLASYGRAAPSHPGLFPAAHVAVVSAGRDVRVSLPALEYGLSSELCGAEAVGRAAGLAHVSPALSIALRHGAVSSVARSLGALGGLMLTQPLFLTRVRGLARGESEEVSQFAAAFWLLDARLWAAAALARGARDPGDLDRAAEPACRALTRSLPVPLAVWLIARVSPGGPLRAKVSSLALAAALRERFDEDWFRNPRAGEPLRGALAQGGALAVEEFAKELGAHPTGAPEYLSALF